MPQHSSPIPTLKVILLPSPTLSPLDLRRPSVLSTFADPQSPLPSPTLSPLDLRRPPMLILFQIALLLQNSYLPVVTIAESRLYLILASESRTDPNSTLHVAEGLRHRPESCPGFAFLRGTPPCAFGNLLTTDKRCHTEAKMEVFTIPHEFRRNPADSAGIQLAGASAIPVSNSMDIPTESAGIWRNGRNPGASAGGNHFYDKPKVFAT
ncbi:hypothetical protein K443DRAFT_8697 [Laccaria amethystina LaAM-08-1]|uniref:Uncharacterized protein n=1 Tax=Laccaria amethystina LaAM-08-1 TaxID=1095629 RepID=A0A0C9X1U5_9AGAR|nr:hypothetical protein K443DRAFT_8697 [Laccaria amethystina LaAM-08-1]